mmetsp:Transcript_21305/g.52141  ORF Transcript_21305/g.52141 Transcript_21305/m.52141 type:complete len:294 (+) Transcript_21305:528-1409(+)
MRNTNNPANPAAERFRPLLPALAAAIIAKPTVPMTTRPHWQVRSNRRFNPFSLRKIVPKPRRPTMTPSGNVITIPAASSGDTPVASWKYDPNMMSILRVDAAQAWTEAANQKRLSLKRFFAAAIKAPIANGRPGLVLSEGVSFKKKYVIPIPNNGKMAAMRRAHRQWITRNNPAKMRIVMSPEKRELSPRTQIPFESSAGFPAHQLPMTHTSAGSVADPTNVTKARKRAIRATVERKERLNNATDRPKNVYNISCRGPRESINHPCVSFPTTIPTSVSEAIMATVPEVKPRSS